MSGTATGRRGSVATAVAAAAALLAAASLPAAAQDAPEATFGDAWESIDCASLGVLPEIAPIADCGYVTLPESRAGESDGQVRLAVVRLRAQTDTPGTPMLYGAGGPGGDGLAWVTHPGSIAPIAPIVGDRDVVVFSQRGSRQAEPRLSCIPWGEHYIEAAQEGWSDEDREAAGIEAMQGCIDDYAAAGTDLSAFNTQESADDIADIAATLGYDQIVYYGQSYGTLLGQFLMRQHPDLLESVILDGVAHATATSETEYTDHGGAFTRVWDACAADEACSAAYPDPEAALQEAFDRLEAEPAMVDMVPQGAAPVPLLVDGTLAMNALFTAGTAAVGGYATLPYVAYQLRDGDYSVLGLPLWHYLNPDGYDAGMFFTMMCTDDPVAELPDTSDKLPMYAAADIADWGRFQRVCPLLGVGQLGDASDEPVVSDIPTLLLQGGVDGPTAVANGEIVKDGLSNVFDVIFPAGTHIQGVSECGSSIIRAFINDPTTEPDTSCVPGYAFAIPLTVTATSDDGSRSFSYTLPPGFELKDGDYSHPFEGATILARFSPETAPEAAIESFIAALPFEMPDNPIADGGTVAGLPAKHYQADVEVQPGAILSFDMIAFADEGGSYVIILQHQVPATVERFREVQFPAILESVTIG